MDVQAEEIGRLHNNLLYTTIAIEFLNPRKNHGEDFARFKSNCRNYLPPPLVQSLTSCDDLLDALEQKGLIKKGDYKVLKDLVSFSEPLLSEIRDVERCIRSIEHKGTGRKNRKRKISESTDESPYIDDLLVRVDFCEIIPLENEEYDAVVKKLTRISRKVFQIGFTLVFNNRDLYKQFNECQKHFNERKEESTRILRLFYFFENEKTTAVHGKQILKFAKEGRKLIKDNPSEFKAFQDTWSMYNERLKEEVTFYTSLTKKGAKVRKQLFGSIFLFLLFDCRENLLMFMDEYRSGLLQAEIQQILITEDFLRCFKLKSARIDIFIYQEDFDSYLTCMDKIMDRDNDDSEQISQMAKKIEAAEESMKEGRNKEAFRQAREMLEEMKMKTTLPIGDEIIRLMNIFREIQSESFLIKTYYQGKLMEGAAVEPWDGWTLWEEFYRKNQNPEMILNAVEEIIEEFLIAEFIPVKGHPVQTMIFQDIVQIYGLIQQRNNQYYIVNDIHSTKMKIVWLFGSHLLKQGKFDVFRRLCVEESRQPDKDNEILCHWANALFFLDETEETSPRRTDSSEKHKETIHEVASVKSSVKDSSDRNGSASDVRSADDESVSHIIEEEVSVEIDEVVERKGSFSSENSESGLSSPTDVSSSSSSETPVKRRRIHLELDEDLAYTGKGSSSDTDSGFGHSVPTESSSYVEAAYRYGRQQSRNKDEDIFYFDEYLNGIQLSKETVDRFKKPKITFHFPYKKLEKNHRKLREMCQNPRFKRCVLDVKGAHEAVCTEIDSPSAKSISISGRSRCGQVFSGDEVVVHILEGGDTIQRLQRDIDSQTYGEVVGFLGRIRHRDVQHPVFLCVFDHTDDQVSSVRPICKTVPKISIRHMKDTGRNEIELYKYYRNHQTLSFIGTKLINSKVRHSLVLLVAYIEWENGIYPYGVVLNFFERGYSLKQELDLLAFQNGIEQRFSLDSQQFLTESQSSKAFRETKERDGFCEIFTITRSESDIPCHAFSFRALASGIQYLGIHVVDISEVIVEDSPLDVEAGKRGHSFQSESYEFSMIPEEIVNRFCKFNDESAVPTISVTFEVDANGTINQTRTRIQRSHEKLSYSLSYNEVQNIIDEGDGSCRRCEDKKECHLIKMLNIAKTLRRSRLGDAEFAYCLEMEIDDGQIDIDIEKYHDVRVITEEFLHLTNFYTAVTLQSEGKVFPIIHQAPPKEQFIKIWKKSFQPLWNFVISLQNFTFRNGDKVSVQKESLNNIRYTKIIGVQTSFWEQIVKCIEQSDI